MPKIKFQERNNKCTLLRNTQIHAQGLARGIGSACLCGRGDWRGQGGQAENGFLFL